MHIHGALHRAFDRDVFERHVANQGLRVGMVGVRCRPINASKMRHRYGDFAPQLQFPESKKTASEIQSTTLTN